MDDPSTTGPGPGVPIPVPEPPGPDLIPEPEPGPEPQPPDVQPSPDPSWQPWRDSEDMACDKESRPTSTGRAAYLGERRAAPVRFHVPGWPGRSVPAGHGGCRSSRGPTDEAFVVGSHPTRAPVKDPVLPQYDRSPDAAAGASAFQAWASTPPARRNEHRCESSAAPRDAVNADSHDLGVRGAERAGIVDRSLHWADRVLGRDDALP